ncbi:hypothetical protein LTR85_011289 [Meristemomyces frigidus]|nr:hypothetical protein LTR85_011289 [Meristemomyces frigidus]
MASTSKAPTYQLSNYVSVSTGNDHLHGDLAREDAESGNTEEMPLDEKLSYAIRPVRSFWMKDWIWEILSAAASISAFVAIIVVLKRYDERTIPTLPLGVTLNGLVSILAAISKATMMTAIAAAIAQCRWLRFAGKRPRKLRELQVFDDASRGPFGSLVLLYSTRLMSLAVLGAILTIASLGFDPFLQSLIHTDVRTIYSYDTGASLIPVTTISDPGDYVNGLSVAYRDAVVSALADDAPSFDSVPTCQSKNCTWPTYSTLRVCSSCKNIKSWVQNRTGSDGGCSQEPLFPSVDGGYEISDGENRYNCQYEMPKPFAAFTFSYTSEYGVFFDTPLVLSNAVSGSGNSTSEAAALLGESGFNPPVAFTATVRFDDAGGFQDAYLCSLGLCLDKMDTSVRNGVTSNTVVDSMTLAAVQYDQNYSKVDSGYQYGYESTHNATLIFSSQVRSPDQGSSGSRVNLTMALGVWFGLEKSLPSYFTGNYTQTGRSIVGIDGTNEPSAADEILDGMTRTTDFIAMMDRVAASLTKRMRQASDQTVFGQTGSSETYIKIHWGWAALPAMVVAGGILFLAVAIFETHRRGVEIWKSSSLPMLYTRTDGELKHHEESITLSQMEHLADQTRVTLSRSSGDGWRFRLC